jgi:SAM-dependent methyltransferase
VDRAPAVMAFEEVYRRNLWNGVESRSGPGSGTASTKHVAEAIVALVEELGVKSVLDVGCGDSFWMPELPGYIGVDVASEAVSRARALHPARRYERARARLPRADLVICRDVIQHLSLVDAGRLVDRIARSGATWLLASTYDGGEVEDIESGEAAWSPDLTQPPFELGEPERRIFDGYDWAIADQARDPRKHLGLWRLA